MFLQQLNSCFQKKRIVIYYLDLILKLNAECSYSLD